MKVVQADHFRARVFALTIAVVPSLVGCMPEISMDDMKAMVPQRPAELDRLNMLVGTWKGTGTGTMIGMQEPLQVTGVSKTEWQADGWYLVENAEYKMGDMEPMKMIGIWTWDPRSEKYRSWFFDTMGGTGMGAATYNEATATWTIKAKGASPMGKTKGRGTIHVGPDTMTWNWKEYPRWDVFRIMKVVEMNGTSTKQ